MRKNARNGNSLRICFFLDVKQYIEDTRRVGQTFLLDIVKTEQQFDHIQREYIRPTIPDDDVMIVNATKQFKSATESISRMLFYQTNKCPTKIFHFFRSH